MKKNPNDRMLDKSGEFLLNDVCLKVYIIVHTGGFCFVPGGFWSVPGGFWSVPGGFWSVRDGFWSVLLGSRFSIRVRMLPIFTLHIRYSD